MSLPPPILTIAIPTYNRAEKLRAQLERLVPQLTPEVRLAVFDNASPDHTREVAAAYRERGLAYACAVTNCGWGRNFFRCFEECRTEWLWMLSDDDLAGPGAVAQLLALLRGETADFVHTSSWVKTYDRPDEAADIAGFFARSNFGALLYISTGIYRVRSFQPYFRLFNEAVFTTGPHLAMVLALLESGRGRLRLSPVSLTTPPVGPPAWSTLDFLQRMSLGPEFLSRPANQRLLAERLFFEVFNDFILMGLRDTGTPAGVRRWQRINRQARRNLRAYGATMVAGYCLRNAWRPGLRKICLGMLKQALVIGILGAAPAGWFHFLARRLPVGRDARERYYNRRENFEPYC
jgi:glycosyltransferase involved in cell wall biosynthesis